MNRIETILSEAKVFFLATTSGTQPKIRPISTHIEVYGTVLFGLDETHQVYRQVMDNPQVEIVAMVQNKWLRYTGRAVFEAEPAYEQLALERFPLLKNIYNTETGKHLRLFHLEDASAFLMDGSGNAQPISI